MKNLNLNSTEWCDMIFEGKNKSYGAFELRQSSSKRHLVAFGVIILFVVFVAFLPSIVSKIEAATRTHTDGIDDVYTTSVIDIDNTVIEKPEEFVQPEMPEPPKFVAMQKFSPPKIVDDADAPEESEMANMDDLLKDKTVAIGAFEVKNGSKDADAVRKELENLIVAKPKEDKPEIIFGAEIMPQFPGGDGEMYKYIKDNLKYPVVDQEMGIQGKVTVRFVVSKTGDITDIQVLKGVSPSCDKEAARVIKSMPRWIPGKQQGNPVHVYFTMPIVFKLQ
ncbi:MAG: TonB family protein [Dysgonomonas sp.]|nr:TonB family protein [Dysgonomonas sp.]